ncbi:MAG: endonuclease/exonuclease/phosphatase family protein [Acidobacteriaceae bacterium]|nr:endonuclease/exonuclease/phosphatase family protein [Acidobacteriaceae bacterium]
MDHVLRGNFADSKSQLPQAQALKVVSWNINRGLRLGDILGFLKSQAADLLILQEVDLNARRTGYLNVAEELARNLSMNYAFGCEFQELTQGSSTGAAYHGQATLSRGDVANPRLLRFRRQSNFWRPRWFVPAVKPFQKRLGGRIALVSDVDLAGTRWTIYNVHLESRGGNDLRHSQLQEILKNAEQSVTDRPRVLAGDLNFDVSRAGALCAIEKVGFRSVLGARKPHTTASGGIFRRPRAIDWAFVSGHVEVASARVHSDVGASDHYPISITLRLSPKAVQRGE